jgi:hypothetical protein
MSDIGTLNKAVKRLQLYQLGRFPQISASELKTEVAWLAVTFFYTKTVSVSVDDRKMPPVNQVTTAVSAYLIEMEESSHSHDLRVRFAPLLFG